MTGPRPRSRGPPDIPGGTVQEITDHWRPGGTVMEPWHVALIFILLIVALVWFLVRAVRRSIARRRT